MMRGYMTNYVNLIADNLRDRYENGFPILKELIQNADDAKAQTLIFGRHEGFRHASHPLLEGPGLWFLNDGAFTERDAQDLRSFGINSKAGDAGVIGKFGLGMKSVFHLCEALFYVAWDGTQFHREGLTPWKQGGQSHHPEWDVDTDWDQYLKPLGETPAATRNYKTWFLLWLPLRMKRHLRTLSGQEPGAIINRFPGDDPSGELAFLNDGKLAHHLAEMLPLLRHLGHVEQAEYEGDKGFVLTLDKAPRLTGDPPCELAYGHVLLNNERPLLTFSGTRLESPDVDGRFQDMKARKEWPRARYRDARGHECEVEDNTVPEAVVLFCSGYEPTCSHLQWAVFLPVEEGGEALGTDDGKRGHSLVLHGQFFLDAGRKRIHGLDRLHENPADMGESQIEDSELRTAWNQRLAQDVLLPLVLPALEQYAEHLPDAECGTLTKALSRSDWFKKCRAHVCRDAFWMRTLTRGAGPRWRSVTGDARSRLRPVPTPPLSATERPWRVFPSLAACSVMPYDVDAPRLGDACRHWDETELADLLSDVDGLFVKAWAMDYLAEFLDSCSGSCLSTENVQRQLIALLRNSLRAAGIEARRKMPAKARRLISFVESKRRLALPSDLPETVLKSLWAVDAAILLVPKGLEELNQRGNVSPDERTLTDWLQVLDRALNSEKGDQESILEVVRGLLQTLSVTDRGRFLRTHLNLRVIAVRDARSGEYKPVNFEDLERVRDAGTLFSFAEGLSEAPRFGIAPQVARAIPDTEVWLVRAPTHREIFPGAPAQEGSQSIPLASSGVACLAAVGRQRTGRLGDRLARRELLQRANDPGTDKDARRGLRLLLHGSLDHRIDDTATLWIGRHGQHPAWRRLWDAMHERDRWSRVPDELADAVPRVHWDRANIDEIDPGKLIDELHMTHQGIKAPERFSEEERDEILSKIKDADLWRRVPLHTTLDGTPASADGNRVYLASPVDQHNDSLTRDTTIIARSTNAGVETQQKQWLRPLDDRARIEIALSTTEPSRYCRMVMDALRALDEGAIDDELRQVLRNTPWLQATHDTPVRPEDVIDLPSLRDEVDRLVAEHRETCGPSFFVPTEIRDHIQDHEAWETLREVGFSADVHGLERLGLLLADLPEYHVGTWPNQPEPDEIALLSQRTRLPGWWLLEMAAADPFDWDTAWTKLAPALLKEIDAKRLADVLNYLSKSSEQWTISKSVHDTYLRQLKAHGQAAKKHICRLRLASASGQWQEAAELCVGARGVVRDRLLDGEQENILGSLVCRAGSIAPRGDEFQADRNATCENLRKYFEPWGSNLVPAPMIGVVLALLGRDARDLASEYLRPHSFDWFITQLTWERPEQPAQQPGPTNSETVTRALKLVKTVIRVETGSDTEVLNLLGQPMRVALDQDTDALLAGAPRWQDDLGVNTPMSRVVALTASGGGAAVEGYEAMIRLRQIVPLSARAKLRELLRSTAEQLYTDLYDQANADFSALWETLDRSDQLDIGIARRLILDHLPFYLRQLSVTCDGIEKKLDICELKRRRIAEADAAADVQSAESHRRELREAVDDLADRIEQGPAEQQAVVQAVKAKLGQYQYELSSIPFELFQNADDAVVELGQFHAHSGDGCDVPPAAQHFVVEERGDGIRFLHWGRPINARGPVDFGGERRGYARDLEKMLILSASDKPKHEGVTGKFGLGFKSVLLACEEPRILSGRSAIRVVSGVLPQPWEDNDAQDARQRLTALGADPRLPGTLIELPGVEEDLRDLLLRPFRQLAGILGVFSRVVRYVTYIATSSESAWRWQPREICPRVEVGELDLRGDWGARTAAICVRTASGSLLTALGSRGLHPLPDPVPALWVTAPTRESSGVGFAINGDFDLDAGRGRLAGSTAKNLEIANRIGVETGDALGVLLLRSRTDWDTVRAELGLAANVDSLTFWESVWVGLTTGWLDRAERDGVGLVRKVALGALARLAGCPRAIPNGLKGSLRGFTDASAIRYELTGVLLQEDVHAALGGWTRFTDCYSWRNCVSPKIGHILRQANLCDPEPLNLSALVDLLERFRTEQADAYTLGRLWLLTTENPDWQSDDLRKQLNKVLFQSETGEWVEARTLLALHGPGLDPDEARRHLLAPPECRLRSTYYIETDGELPAAAFFLVCRRRMEAPAEKVAQWVLDAESDEARFNALAYLADGAIGWQVAELVREKGWLLDALYDRKLLERLTAEQVDNLRRRLASQQRLAWIVGPGSISPDPQPGPDAAQRIFGAIHDWWLNTKDRERQAYAVNVYPESFSLSQLQNNRDRAAWFTMFALACFQSLGRTQDDQHRGFIERGIREGWWHELAASKPPDDVQSWLERLERWSASARDDQDFVPWKRTFVDLYTIARWLDRYIQLACKFPRILRDEPYSSLDAVLRPSYTPEAAKLGLDAAPINRSLGIGANWLIRELVRHRVVYNGPDDEHLLAPYCWASTQRVRDLLNRLGANTGAHASSSASGSIYNFVVEHSSVERARFDGDFDLPLQIITRSEHRVTRNDVFADTGLDPPDFRDEFNDGSDETQPWRTP